MLIKPLLSRVEKRTKSQRSGQENEDAEGLDHNTAMVSVLDDEPSDIAREKFKAWDLADEGGEREVPEGGEDSQAAGDQCCCQQHHS